MSNTVGAWIPLIFTTLGAGAVGSIITTYGGQGRTRRKARSRAMSALEHIESARLARTVGEGFEFDREAFAELEARCMMAGVPRQPVYWFSALSQSAHGKVMDPGPIIATYRLITYSSLLIYQVLWHPWLSRILLPYRLWRLRRAIKRCSKVQPMEFLNKLYVNRDYEHLGGLWEWVERVERLERQRGQ